MTKPSWRKPVGVFAILGLIALWAVIVVSFAGTVERWPILVQALFYLAAGLVWVLPLKPLLRWMEGAPFKD